MLSTPAAALPEHALRCRHCYTVATGRDLLALTDLSYSATLRGHSPASLRELALELENTLVHGVTVWCPRCFSLGISVFPLLADGAPPAPAAVAEHVLGLHEARVLHALLCPPHLRA